MKSVILNLYTTDEFANFECKKCGSCCKGWDIHLDGATSRKLHKALKRLGYKQEWHHKKGKGNCLNMVEGRCIFLQEDNLCYIHLHLGYEQKPLVCRSFPSGVFATPKGGFHTLTFACPATVQLLGEGERFMPLKIPSSVQMDVPSSLLLHDKIRIGWDLYFWIEEALYEMIFEGEWIEDALVLCSALLWTLYSLLKNGADERGLKAYIISERNKEYKTLREQSLKYRANVKTQHAFLKSFSSFLKRASPALFSSLPSFSPTPIQYMREVHRGWPKNCKALQKALKKYVQYKIFGKYLLNPSLSLLLAFNVLLIHHALIRWCTAKSEQSSNLERLKEAILKVERLFYHTFVLKKVWKELGRFQILSKPEFANIILRV